MLELNKIIKEQQLLQYKETENITDNLKNLIEKKISNIIINTNISIESNTSFYSHLIQFTDGMQLEIKSDSVEFDVYWDYLMLHQIQLLKNKI